MKNNFMFLHSAETLDETFNAINCTGTDENWKEMGQVSQRWQPLLKPAVLS